jgi:lipopolysaccharide/colanic/teichoic acid biosynthesis glycosyltransferase
MVGACLGLLLLSPVMLLTAISIRVILGKPILFPQLRPGFAGRAFTLYKFRTMRNGNAGTPDELRLTRFGTLLRAASLDELPQLWNVLRGDMSLVGPRPLLTEYLDRYSPEQHRRHQVLPGITGWAQVNGRNAVTWEQRFALDLWYVEHMSLALDLRIVWLTLIHIFARTGISHKGHATMPRFKGSECVDRNS